MNSKSIFAGLMKPYPVACPECSLPTEKSEIDDNGMCGSCLYGLDPEELSQDAEPRFAGRGDN